MLFAYISFVIWTFAPVVPAFMMLPGPALFSHHREYGGLALPTEPLGLPQRPNLVHGYLPEDSGLDAYRRFSGETSLLGLPGGESKWAERMRAVFFPDFVGFVSRLRNRHRKVFGPNTQFKAVTPYPLGK